jgi:hypothetical protein
VLPFEVPISAYCYGGCCENHTEHINVAVAGAYIYIYIVTAGLKVLIDCLGE